MAKYCQGKFTPKNKHKYKGNLSNITFRSSWELKAFNWCDKNNRILKWSSEEIIIPYISPIDNRKHRYFTDLYIEFLNKDGELQKTIIEIKPKRETKPPRKNSKNYLKESRTFAVNQTKWQYARKYAKKRGMEFMVLTEYELGIK